MNRAISNTDPAALEYHGPRVSLRYPRAKDAEAFVELRRSSREFLERWEPAAPKGFDAFGEDSFRRELLSCRVPERESLLICRRENGRVIGRISLQQIIRGPLQQCFLGYWMGEAFAGQGFMKEAIGLSLGHAFGRVKLHRVEANVQPNNLPSKGVLRANGFRLEGFSPRYLEICGVWADHERWAIHADEWHERAQL